MKNKFDEMYVNALGATSCFIYNVTYIDLHKLKWESFEQRNSWRTQIT